MTLHTFWIPLIVSGITLTVFYYLDLKKQYDLRFTFRYWDSISCLFLGFYFILGLAFYGLNYAGVSVLGDSDPVEFVQGWLSKGAEPPLWLVGTLVGVASAYLTKIVISSKPNPSSDLTIDGFIKERLFPDFQKKLIKEQRRGIVRHASILINRYNKNNKPLSLGVFGHKVIDYLKMHELEMNELDQRFVYRTMVTEINERGNLMAAVIKVLRVMGRKETKNLLFYSPNRKH